MASPLVNSEPEQLYHGLLAGVSRTFALSIPELPAPLCDWVECGYLLCRMADTLEDRPEAGEIERQDLFDLLGWALGPPVDAAAAAELADRCRMVYTGPDACSHLMSCARLVFERLAEFPPAVVQAMRACVQAMVAGLRRTPHQPDATQPAHLFQSIHELERYCHWAAGLVGVMLARLFAVQQDRDPWALSAGYLHDAKRFGRGLQITNILKDHPRDLLDGRCFLPVQAARACAVDPAVLLQPRLPRSVQVLLARRAAAHLDRGLVYTLAFPATQRGIRLFCFQPLIMAVLTLIRVLADDDVTPTDLPRISRAQVAEVMSASHRLIEDNVVLTRWFEHARRELDAALGKGSGSL